jgi:hypothetical protein
MATLLPVDGPPVLVTPANGDSFSLVELQGFVGGYIEGIRLPDNQWMFVNEEGKLHGLPYNPFATHVFKTLRPAMIFDDYIVGPAIICTTQEAGGDDSGAT